ncbi:MAG TPA: helix-turn-helix transcriptional regulator [Fodinibius sp.]|nr:helix-turn-helix transcriptional regulator [Fodinibius sp.]
MNKQKTQQIREEFKQLESPNARLIDKQMEIASQISRYLREQGLNQKELAQKADIGESQLSEIMRGEGNPTLKTLVKIEEALSRDVIVAPSFHKEDLVREGFVDIPAQHLEEFTIETFSESVIGVSKQLVYGFDQGNITYEEDPQPERKKRPEIPLAS